MVWCFAQRWSRDTYWSLRKPQTVYRWYIEIRAWVFFNRQQDYRISHILSKMQRYGEYEREVIIAGSSLECPHLAFKASVQLFMFKNKRPSGSMELWHIWMVYARNIFHGSMASFPFSILSSAPELSVWILKCRGRRGAGSQYFSASAVFLFCMKFGY